MIHDTIKELIDYLANPIIFEVGARHGEDSKVLINSFPDGEFWIFEPLPSNFEKLKQNIKPRDDIYDNVYLVDMALSDKNGYADFHVSSDSQQFNGSSSLLKPKQHLEAFPHVKFNEVIRVQTRDLDSFCSDVALDHIDFLWMDTQGAEQKIIKGGQKMLKRTKYLYSEYYESEMYEGQVPFSVWKNDLPGKWSVIEKWPNDVLLVNDDF